jgi:DNA-binding Lrp family transcriptional regulator
MALKTNFTDDILSESMNGKRQYNVTENSNGTKSLEDVTDYQSVGSTFSAKDMNETNAAVNQAHNDIRELTENLTEYVSMKYVSTGDSDVHIKFKIIDTSQLRAYITALITSQSGQPVMLTVSINIGNNTIKSWNQITPINNSFGIQSVNIEEGGIQVKFNSVGVWGVCQYWGTGISI